MYSVPLHATLAPPGHYDFDISTTFPHCPRCKNASGERWAKTYSSTPLKCIVCGHVYVPADTASSIMPENSQEGHDELENVLSPDEYAALVATWMKRFRSASRGPDDWFWR